MSFKKISGRRPDHKYPSTFFFPDVSGNSLALLNSAQEFARTSMGPVYLWDHTQASAECDSLDTYAAQVAEEISRKCPQGPLFLAGYSWGSSLAKVVAHHLISQGRTVAFYGIDSPSIADSQTYLQDNNLAATQDLIAIFNYAAALANIPPLPLTWTATEPFELVKKPFKQQIEDVKRKFAHLIQNLEKQRLPLFLEYANTITQNLINLLDYQGKALLEPINKMGLLFSAESSLKYPNLERGWLVPGQVAAINRIPGSNHQSLMGEHHRETAAAMKNFFENCFSPAELPTAIHQITDKERYYNLHLRDHGNQAGQKKGFADFPFPIPSDSPPRTPPSTPSRTPPGSPQQPVDASELDDLLPTPMCDDISSQEISDTDLSGRGSSLPKPITRRALFTMGQQARSAPESDDAPMLSPRFHRQKKSSLQTHASFFSQSSPETSHNTRQRSRRLQAKLLVNPNPRSRSSSSSEP